jgi:secretion/DNA translocation related TadE-like protein
VTTRTRDERGGAALVVVTMAGLLVVLAATVGVLGRLLVDQRRVEAAADLAALAGAVAVQHHRDACPAAAEVAGRNGAELVSCTVAGDRVRVVTGVDTPILVRTVPLRGAAHAGPVSR